MEMHLRRVRLGIRKRCGTHCPGQWVLPEVDGAQEALGHNSQILDLDFE